MPIFVSRFSSERSGLANFRSLRTAGEDTRTNRRNASLGDQEGNQAVPSDEDQTGAVSRLLVASQQADRVAQSISEQNSSQQSSLQTAADTGATETSTPEPASVVTPAQEEPQPFFGTGSAAESPVPVPVTVETAGSTPVPAETRNALAAAAARGEATRNAVARRSSELTISQRMQLGRAQALQAGRTQAAQAQADQNQARTQLLPDRGVTEARLAIQPSLQSTVRRLDNLTRLISANRRDLERGTAQPASVTVQARLTTSLRIDQSAAQASVVRTAQAIQTARASQTQEALQEASTPSPATAPEETVAMKQNLREDVATVTRGLVHDAARQSSENAQKIAQRMLVAATTRTSRTVERPDFSLRDSRLSLGHPSLLGAPSTGGDRQVPTFSNLSPLRSALALLGTKVNILIG